MCGEKCFWLKTLIFCAGSPPHVRGKGKKIARKAESDGITPACAGKSISTVVIVV